MRETHPEGAAAGSTAAGTPTCGPITCEVGHPAAHARLGALHARRDAGARRRHARHVVRRAEDRRPDRRALEALHAALQLPALQHRRGEVPARPGPARDRPRRARRARARADHARRGGVPLHDPHRLRDARVERLVLDGDGLRRLAVADGRGRADQGAGRRHRDGPHQGGRRGPRPLRHPRRRGPPRRHGLQGRRHRGGHHRDPDGHQDRRRHARDHASRRSSRRARRGSTSSAR